MATIGSSRTVSKMNGDFNRKSQNFPIPVSFAPPLKGLASEFGYGSRGRTTRMMVLSVRERNLRYLQLCGYSPPTW